MRKWVYLAALLLAFTLAPKGQTQVRLVDPTARTANHKRLCKLVTEYNSPAARFNQLLGGKSVYEVEPVKLLETVQEMRKKLDEMESTLIHFDESEP